MTQSTAEYDFLYDSPTGQLGVCIDAESITKIIWLEQDALETSTLSPSKPINSELKKKIISALDNYFESGLIESEISLCPQGTRFQQKVWQALKRIPSGTVKTYGDVARELQTSSRAIVLAVLPCMLDKYILKSPSCAVVISQLFLSSQRAYFCRSLR